MREEPISSFVTGCHSEAKCKRSQSAALLQDLAVRPDASAALLQEDERAFAIG